jgi:hypothetical protein
LEGNPLQWRWVNELGVHNAVDARELMDALLTGRMTPHVWVWRTGWTSWFRASQVAELATAIPKGARMPPVAIAIDPAAQEPPTIPRYSYRASTYVRHMSTPVPPTTHQRPLVRRPAAPTLVDSTSSAQNVSHTLRPPGAVPPPPRTISGAFSFDVQRALDLAHFASDQGTPHPSSAISTDLVMRSVLGDDDRATHEASPARVAVNRPPRTPVPTATRAQTPARSTVRNRKWLLAGSFSLIAAVGLFAIVMRSPHRSQRPATALPSSSASPHPRQPCHLVGVAERLAPSIALNVTPIVANAADGKSLAVGFADTANSAAGILVDPITRSVKYVFREAGTSRVASVVPRLQDEQLSFAVARDKESFKEARFVTGAPDFTLGQSVEGFARQVGSANPETIWTTDIDTPCTGARLVTIAGIGHAVTFRQGGQSGTVQVGWLTPDGHNRAHPMSLTTSAKSVGQPSIAASGAHVLVTFAGRASDSDPWSLHAALWDTAGANASARQLPTATGGPGGDAIAPVAAGLEQGQFILQWSEGSTGHRQVRVQTLDAHLQPLGPAVNVSPTDSNAGQGVLWVNREHAVSLFVVNVGRSAELWAASLQCPSG